MLSWAAATLLTGWVIMAFLFIRYVWFLGISSLAGGGLFVLFLFMGSLPLLTGYKFENLLHGFYPYYRYALYFIFVGSVILLVLTLAVDAGWFIGHRLGWFDCLPYSREYCIRFNKFILAAAFLCTCYALYAGTKIPEIKKISLTSEKIEKPRTIAVLSDLHIHRIINPQKIAGIIERTNAQNPDIILLAGDIIDDRISRVSEIVALLKNLKARDGIYFVTGNHEFYAGYQTAVAELKKLGFRFLENEGINLQDIWLAGIPDATAGGRYGKKIDLSQTFAGARPGQFRLRPRAQRGPRRRDHPAELLARARGHSLRKHRLARRNRSDAVPARCLGRNRTARQSGQRALPRQPALRRKDPDGTPRRTITPLPLSRTHSPAGEGNPLEKRNIPLRMFRFSLFPAPLSPAPAGKERRIFSRKALPLFPETCGAFSGKRRTGPPRAATRPAARQPRKSGSVCPKSE